MIKLDGCFKIVILAQKKGIYARQPANPQQSIPRYANLYHQDIVYITHKAYPSIHLISTITIKHDQIKPNPRYDPDPNPTSSQHCRRQPVDILKDKHNTPNLLSRRQYLPEIEL
jgi:hypothetical protein